jgi:hypothetical protein
MLAFAEIGYLPESVVFEATTVLDLAPASDGESYVLAHIWRASALELLGETKKAAQDLRAAALRIPEGDPRLELIEDLLASLGVNKGALPRPNSALDFQIGDCFDDPTSVEVDEVPGFPCEEAHDNEAYAIFDHEDPDQPWPGQDAIDEYAYTACIDRFLDYVGTPYDDSRLEVSSFTPLEVGWNSGDHEIVCFLYDLNFEKLVGTMRWSGE